MYFSPLQINIFRSLKRGQVNYFTVALMLFLASFILLPNSKMVNNFYYVFLALPTLFMVIARRVPGPLVNLPVTPWLIFFAWLVLTGWLESGFDFYRHLLYVILFCLSVCRLAEPAHFDRPVIVRAFFWGLILYVIASTIYYWAMSRYSPGDRIVDLPARLAGPILSSMLIVCCYALAGIRWIQARQWFEALLGTLAMLLCILFILQSSSGIVGLITLSVVAGLYVLVGGSLRAKLVFLMTAVGLPLLAMGVTLSTKVGMTLLNRMDSGRFELWVSFLDKWGQCGWLSGCGYADVSLHTSLGEILHPHSIFLSHGFYSGLPALVLLIVALGTTLVIAVRQSNPWGLFLLLALAMLNFDGHRLISNPDELWLLVWLPAMLIMARELRAPSAKALK